MGSFFTRSMDKKEVNVGNEKKWEEGPKKETLEFLQRFARICCSEPELNSDLRIVILN